MKYIAVSLYRKMIEHPLTEGMWLKDFDNLPVPYTQIQDIKAVSVDFFLNFMKTQIGS